MTWIRRASEHVVRGTTVLGWYYRARPEALRFLAAPALAALLVMLLAVAWGSLSLMLLAPLVVVGAFAVFAVPLVDEIRSLERVAANPDVGPLPWLAGIAEEELELPSETRALAEEPSRGAVETAAVAEPVLSSERWALAAEAPRGAVKTAAVAEPVLSSERWALAAEAPRVALKTAAAAPPSAPVSLSLSTGPAYELLEVEGGERVVLQAGVDFVEMCDVAFELIEERDPDGLEIVRVTGEEREPVWTHGRSEWAARREQRERPLPPRGDAQPTLTELFGFDPTRWVGPPTFRPSRKR